MKIVFFGTPSFASMILEYLVEKNIEVTAVVTNVDKKSGRGKKINQSPVKIIANKYNLLVLQPTNLKDPVFTSKLNEINADLFVVVAFRMLPYVVWKIPSKGTINLHTSLLPKYRGAAPINWVIINGEKTTGLTTFFIDDKIDCGKIILQKEINILDNYTAAILHNLLIDHGKILLEKTIYNIFNNKLNLIVQESNLELPIARKLTKELFKINWDKTADEINNLVKGLSPLLEDNTVLKDNSIFPGAWFFLEDNHQNKKRVKIYKCAVVKSTSNELLKISTDNNTFMNINTKKDEISILELQVEGKKSMNIEQFLKGYNLTNCKIL